MPTIATSSSSRAQGSSHNTSLSNVQLTKSLSATLPPRSEEVEQLVLGALILEKDAYPQVQDILSTDCFYGDRNRAVFDAIRGLAETERPVDAVTVMEQLKSTGDLEKVGVAYIATLTSIVNSTAHLGYHARVLYDKMTQRRLISFGNSVIQNAFDEEKDVTDTMTTAESDLFAITQGANKDDVQSVKELMPSVIESIKVSLERKEGMSGINTGFRELDQITSGWQKSDLVIIAARPAMGKTAFILSMARAMAVDYGTAVGIFSLEMSKAQLMTRLVVNHSGIANEKIKRGNISAEELQRFMASMTNFEDAPIYIDDNSGLTVFDLRSKVRRLVRNFGVQIIFIDYLQLMTASGLNTNANREQEVSTISRSLKQLAKELNITVVALSQLNRGVENRPKEGKVPQLSDLRESGAIEQDADMVCFIHRPEYYEIYKDDEGNDLRGLAQIIVAKHRNGQVGKFYLRFDSEHIRFTSALDNPINDYRIENIGSNLNGGSGEHFTPTISPGGFPTIPDDPMMEGQDVNGFN